MADSDNLPTLEEILKRRGIVKGVDFDDYQDYIESQEKTLRPRLLKFSGIFPEGSMHLAMGRVIPTRKLKLRP
ncbi:MAG: hypothetical protein HQL95_13980 [Magnetococcales bacterium]|nr:hypothetical protein [Magnetococcales bacterium]